MMKCAILEGENIILIVNHLFHLFQLLIDDIKENFNLRLEKPVMRNHPFSLQDLAAAKVCDLMKNYENISQLKIPKTLKD